MASPETIFFDALYAKLIADLVLETPLLGMAQIECNSERNIKSDTLPVMNLIWDSISAEDLGTYNEKAILTEFSLSIEVYDRLGEEPERIMLGHVDTVCNWLAVNIGGLTIPGTFAPTLLFGDISMESVRGERERKVVIPFTVSCVKQLATRR